MVSRLSDPPTHIVSYGQAPVAVADGELQVVLVNGHQVVCEGGRHTTGERLMTHNDVVEMHVTVYA